MSKEKSYCLWLKKIKMECRHPNLLRELNSSRTLEEITPHCIACLLGIHLERELLEAIVKIVPPAEIVNKLLRREEEAK